MRLLLIIVFLGAVTAMNAQVLDLPLSHEAYGFMDRMEAKGYLSGYKDAIRPMPRRIIAGQLLELRQRISEMTPFEAEELEFLLQEFRQEYEYLGADSLYLADRWLPYTLPVSDGYINLTPNMLFEKRMDRGEALNIRILGAQVSGHVFGKMSFYFNYIGSNENGRLINIKKQHTPQQGIPYYGLSGPFEIEYNSNQSSLSYDFGAFDLSLEQTMNTWGNERYGNLALSTKAPAFPKVKLRARLADWLHFTYIHGELHSGIVDSLRSYEAGTSVQKKFPRTVYRSKYFASHVFELNPWDLFDLTLGESIIYTDRGASLLYLIPVAFFKSGEHYHRDTDNTQIFIAADVPLGNGVTVTGTFFVDEISIGTLGDPVNERNQIGYSFGTQLYDLPVEDLEMTAEYTRINPWVYSHKYAAATYTNNGFVMGHWIGENADLATVDLTYRFSRSFNAGIQFQMYRKGDTSDVANQYTIPSEQFLYGRRRIERTVTLSASYQPVRDGFIEAYYRYGSVADDQRTIPSRSGTHEAMLRIRYGIW